MLPTTIGSGGIFWGPGRNSLSPQTEFGIRLAPLCCQQRFAEACKFYGELLKSYYISIVFISA
eukprot:CCRYP_014703-RB/>CCRYP_014703-RB protein AED:0.10 eAED:0.10 QI:28/1/1/1/0/0/2/193/62